MSRKEDFSSRTKREVLDRAGHASEISGRSDAPLHIDHIQAIRNGGRGVAENAQVLTIDEHEEKHQTEDGFSPAEKYNWRTFQRGFNYNLYKQGVEHKQPE